MCIVNHIRLIRLYKNCRPALASRIAGHTSALTAVLPLEEQVWIQVGSTQLDLDRPPYDRYTPHQVHWIEEGAFIKTARALAEHLDRYMPEYLHCHGPRMALLGTVAKLFSRGAKPLVVYEVHGAAAFEEWYLSSNKLAGAGKFLGYYAAESLTAVLSQRLLLVSDRIEKYYPLAKLRPSVSVPRLVDPSPSRVGVVAGSKAHSMLEFVEQAHKDDCKVVVYTGSAASWQKVDETIRLMSGMVDHGSYRALIITRQVDELRDRITNHYKRIGRDLPGDQWMIGGLEQSEVIPVLEGCDVGVLLRDDVVLNRVASPTKLYEYLYAGLLVISTSGIPEAAIAGSSSGSVLQIELDVLIHDPNYVRYVVKQANELLPQQRHSEVDAHNYTWVGHRSLAAEAYGLSI